MIQEIKDSKAKPEDTISVTDFIEQVNASLLSHHARVQGEVTSISKNYPTAIYFTIKDTKDEALLNCIIWRSVYDQNGVDLDVGDEIIVTGTPEVYPRNGRFSLKTQTIEYAGEGALKKAYEELKKKLSEEGLFTQERKRELPKYPQRIGVITSKVGVVMQDFSSNLGHYGFKVIMTDSRVEGKDAIHDILASIRTLGKEDIEILVIMRGGGSWESLQPFNTESVVRAIANFKCPVLTGIGHDVDVTLAEMVADVGESTPTAVAEALNESWDASLSSIDQARTKVFGAFQRLLTDDTNSIQSSSTTIFSMYYRWLSSTTQALSNKSTRIYSLFIKLEKKISRAGTALQSTIGHMKSSISSKQRHLNDLSKRIVRFSQSYVGNARQEVADDFAYIFSEQKDSLRNTREYVRSIEKSIKLVDPERNLKLGYSLSYVNGKLIRSIKEVTIGNTIETHLSDGGFTSNIKKIK